MDYLLEVGAAHIDLSGIPAPWPRLLSFENISIQMEADLDEFLNARDDLEEFNASIIEKVSFQVFCPQGSEVNRVSSAVPIESNSLGA